MKQVLTSEAFEAFIHGSIFDKAVFCLGEKQGMLVNDECSSWYNKVGDFLMSVWDKRKEIFYRQSKQPHSRVRGQWHWVL